MKVLALVVARGGSKRVPGKNLRSLGGHPLILWSIAGARAGPEVSEILVSTDDEKIAEIARTAGALVPWLRPSELATDTATSVDVALHALKWYENEHGAVDGVLLIQPTSPFRSKETVRRGIIRFQQNQRQPVVAVSPANDHPSHVFRIHDGVLVPFVASGAPDTRSQDLPQAFVVSGGLYLVSPADLRKRRSFFGCDVVPLVVEDPIERLDIDTEWDWELAEALVAFRKMKLP